METYMEVLGLIVMTALATVVIAGCAFLLLGMWTVVQERFWPL